MSKKHCFQLVSEFSFSHFSYIFQPDGSSTQILGLLTSRSETKLKGWILNAEEVRCQLPPTLRYQIRVQQELAYFLSYLIYYYQESSDTSGQSQLRSLAHVHRDLQFHWPPLFSIPRNPGS